MGSCLRGVDLERLPRKLPRPVDRVIRLVRPSELCFQEICPGETDIRSGKFLIDLHRPFVKIAGNQCAVMCQPSQMLDALPSKQPGLQVRCTIAQRYSLLLSFRDLDLQRSDDFERHLVLKLKDVAQLTIERRSPNDAADARIDQLQRYPYPIPAALQ